MSEIIAKLEEFSLKKSPKSVDSITTIGVVGMNPAAQEIIKNISRYGFDVICIDNTKEGVENGIQGVSSMLDTDINNWGMTTSEKKLILSRIKGDTEYSELSSCDIVIEVINTKNSGTSLEIRKKIFSDIEPFVRPDAVLASNTSTLMVSDIAADLEYPERVVGMHFIFPIDKVKIIELVKGIHTSDEAYNKATKFVKMLEKEPISILESPGNISTRMMCIMINKACDLLMEGIASIDDIDKVMKDSMGHLIGPFELADRISLDRLKRWMDNLYNEFGEKCYKVSPIIKRLIRAGHTGKVTGQGFYKYDESGKIISSTITRPEFN